MARQDILAIVLGGGRGTRLDPLTRSETKPAVLMGGKYRLIDFSISNCINSDITCIFVLTQFLSASLHDHIQRTYQFDIFSSGFVQILAAEQTQTDTHWYLGTADAVRRQIGHLLSRDAEDVLIMSGDHFYRMDYSELIRSHRERQADVSLAVLPVSAADAHRFGILKATDEGRVVAFQEKPQEAEALESLISHHGNARLYLASMGVYVFRVEALNRLLKECGGDDFGRHIIPEAIDTVRVYAFPFEGYWEDIGTIFAFYEANLALTRCDPSLDLYDPNHPLYARSHNMPPSRIDGCRMERVIVADGCRLYDADIEECIIGLRSVVRPGARLRRVVMMGADLYETEDQKEENRRLGRPHMGIGEDTYIERAIIDQNARIGQGVTIRPHEGEEDRDGEHYAIRDGIVVIPKRAVIPDGTII
jgi:glucose-1-phosphate adenylyltransferase